jgi:protein-S-isoprenylcysteine O-methyltransferase Ste14
VAQSVLFAIIGIGGLRDLVGQGSGRPWGWAASLIGLAAIGIGGFVAARGVWDLRAGLSPFPRPIDGAPLIETGAYRLIRHPIYSGLVLGAVGWGLVTGSVVAIVTAGALFLLFAGKSRREEVWLTAAHPGYADYQRRTKRLIPWVY